VIDHENFLVYFFVPLGRKSNPYSVRQNNPENVPFSFEGFLVSRVGKRKTEKRVFVSFSGLFEIQTDGRSFLEF
jgi:hypothetical protein